MSLERRKIFPKGTRRQFSGRRRATTVVKSHRQKLKKKLSFRSVVLYCDLLLFGGPILAAQCEEDRRRRRVRMKTAAGLVWSLLALALFYDCGCHAAGEGDGAGERRSGSGRKQRNRGASLSSFRSESNSRIPHPIDPLFTDQREIRLSLKVWLIFFFCQVV